MKPIEVKGNTYTSYIKEVNDKDPVFKAGDHVRISKYNNIFTKRYNSNCSEKVFMIKEVKSTVLWAYVINYLNGAKITGTFCEKELQKTNQQEFRMKKVFKRKV